MTTFKAAACAVALFGATAVAAVVPGTDKSDAQAVAVQPAPAPAPLAAVFGGGVRLGVSVRDVEDADVKSGKLSAPIGAVVEEVSDDSAAEAGGIRRGDIVVEFDGERVRSARQFTRLVQETAEGRKVNAVVVRDGQRTTLTVEPRSGGAMFDFRKLEDLGRDFKFDVQPRPSRPPAVPRVSPPAVWKFDDLMARGSVRLGISVETLSPQLAEYFGTKDGVLVKSVQDNSTASKIGIRAGDVITSVNGSAIDDATELRRRLQALKDGEEVTIGVVRDKKAQTLKGKLEGTARRRTFRTTA
jgi:serine protease Do